MATEHENDLRTFEKVVSRELAKLMRDGDRRGHLDAVAVSDGTYDANRAWASWKKASPQVRFEPLQQVGVVDCIGYDLRTAFVNGALRVNIRHSDWASRWEPGRRIGQRLSGYVATVVAMWLVRTRNRRRPVRAAAILEQQVRVAARLESAVSIHMIGMEVTQ